MLGLKTLIDEVIEEKAKVVVWPTQYVNQDTHKPFREPKRKEVKEALYSDEPKYVLFRAAEGSGKTTIGTIKMLEKLKRGLSGALICPDYPYMTRIITEVWRWIPWDCVIERHQHYSIPGWKPVSSSFEIKFHNELGTISTLMIGGVSDNLVKFESLNLNFVWIEEPRAIKGHEIMDVLSGRIRIPGPKGEPPQLYLTSTPTSKKHWLYRYFGPIQKNDPLERFKQKAGEVFLPLSENMENLDEGYIEDRAAVLDENERKMRLEGEWGEERKDNKFIIPHLWKRLYDPTLKPVRTKNESGDWSDALVIGMDAGVKHDSFALVGVTRHPQMREKGAVRITRKWKPENNMPLNFGIIQKEIEEIIDEYNVLTIVYDEYQLHQMAENLKQKVWMQPFSQQSRRAIADQQLYQAIIEKRLYHMNQEDLTEHILNANAKISKDETSRRLTKGDYSAKIDLAVALSMSFDELMRLNI